MALLNSWKRTRGTKDCQELHEVELEANDFIHKPYFPADILVRIRKTLDTPRTWRKRRSARGSRGDEPRIFNEIRGTLSGNRTLLTALLSLGTGSGTDLRYRLDNAFS